MTHTAHDADARIDDRVVPLLLIWKALRRSQQR
jgi:hypothetical protein